MRLWRSGTGKAGEAAESSNREMAAQNELQVVILLKIRCADETSPEIDYGNLQNSAKTSRLTDGLNFAGYYNRGFEAVCKIYGTNA
jgi:hypothetical protein